MTNLFSTMTWQGHYLFDKRVYCDGINAFAYECYQDKPSCWAIFTGIYISGPDSAIPQCTLRSIQVTVIRKNDGNLDFSTKQYHAWGSPVLAELGLNRLPDFEPRNKCPVTFVKLPYHYAF